MPVPEHMRVDINPYVPPVLPQNMPYLPPVYPAYRFTVRSVTEVTDIQERTLLERHRVDFPRLLHAQVEQHYPEVKVSRPYICDVSDSSSCVPYETQKKRIPQGAACMHMILTRAKGMLCSCDLKHLQILVQRDRWWKLVGVHLSAKLPAAESLRTCITLLRSCI